MSISTGRYQRARSLGLLTLLGVMTAPLAAQAPRPTGLRNPEPVIHTDSTPRADSVRVAPSQWKEGMIIGGVAGLAIGALGASFARAMCETTDCQPTPLTYLGPTIVFALIGGMIGSGFHRTQ